MTKEECDVYAKGKSQTTKPGAFVEQHFGARVATIREGENAVEIKDNRDGTCDVTVFWIGKGGYSEDATAYALTRDNLMAMRRAIDGMLIQIAAQKGHEGILADVPD